MKIPMSLHSMLRLNILSRYFKLILHQTPALSNTAASRSKGSSNDWGCDFQTTTKTKPSEVEMSKKRRDSTLASSEAASASTLSSEDKRHYSSMLKEQNGQYHTMVSLTIFRFAADFTKMPWNFGLQAAFKLQWWFTKIIFHVERHYSTPSIQVVNCSKILKLNFLFDYVVKRRKKNINSTLKNKSKTLPVKSRAVDRSTIQFWKLLV